VVHYCETGPFISTSIIPASTWEHNQTLMSGDASNQWRWKVQLVREGGEGGVEDLIVSPEAVTPLVWNLESISLDDEMIYDVKVGDILRIRLEVKSGSTTDDGRLFRYRWGNDSPDYRAFTDITESKDETTIPLHVGVNSLQVDDGGLSGGTSILSGINGSGAAFATGLGDREGVPNIVIFITDGNDSNESGYSNIQNAAESSGTEIFTIGVGDDVSWETLYAIAYDPDPSDQDPSHPDYPDAGHVFHTDDYQGLEDVIAQLIEGIEGAASSSGIFYIDSTTLDGSNLRVYVRIQPDGTLEILSYQVY